MFPVGIIYDLWDFGESSTISRFLEGTFFWNEVNKVCLGLVYIKLLFSVDLVIIFELLSFLLKLISFILPLKIFLDLRFNFFVINLLALALILLCKFIFGKSKFKIKNIDDYLIISQEKG